MRRLAVIGLLVAIASTTAAADWKKAYFGQTIVGSWASYRLKSTPGPGSMLKSTRLPDRNGSVQLEDRNTYPGKESTDSTQRYSVAPGFKVERDLLDYPKSLVSFASSLDGTSFEPMPLVAVKTMKEMSPAFGNIAVFAKTETVNGIECDHYTYTLKNAASGETETGDLWLSDTVPFGLVRRAASSKDPSGKVTWTLDMTLTDSGKTSAPSTTAAAKTAPKKGTTKPAATPKKKG